MKLEFNNLKEFEDFIKEIGYIKEETGNKTDENKNVDYTLDKINIVKKECPYGWVECPYQKSITPFYPVTFNEPYCNSDIGVPQNKEWETKTASTHNEKITIDMKDVKNTKNDLK